MISASVVLYNTKDELIDNMITCFNPDNGGVLFFIDNSPNINQYCEKICSRYPNVNYIYNNANLGYGSAHNIALDKAIALGSTYHIVLNPDITYNSSVIDKLKEYADSNMDVVYILPKVLYPDGSVQYLCKLLPNPFDLFFRRFFSFARFAQKRDDIYTLKKTGYNKIINPPCLSGCFMFLRVSTLIENNMRFDDRFFMYCEDFDLIRRLHRVGKTIYYPYTEIIHNHAKESYKNKHMLRIHVVSAIKYFNKYGWFFDEERKIMNKRIMCEISSCNID